MYRKDRANHKNHAGPFEHVGGSLDTLECISYLNTLISSVFQTVLYMGVAIICIPYINIQNRFFHPRYWKGCFLLFRFLFLRQKLSPDKQGDDRKH